MITLHAFHQLTITRADYLATITQKITPSTLAVDILSEDRSPMNHHPPGLKYLTISPKKNQRQKQENDNSQKEEQPEASVPRLLELTSKVVALKCPCYELETHDPPLDEALLKAVRLSTILVLAFSSEH